MKSGFVKLLAVLILVFGIVFFVYNNLPSKYKIPSDLGNRGGEIWDDNNEKVQPTSTKTQVVVINDPDTKKKNIEDVTGGKSLGVAYVLRKNGNLYHIVSASLPNLDENNFYEGWLVNDDGDFFSTGKMYYKANRWILEYNSEGNAYEGYNYVVITLETKDDKSPEKHVIEGKVE